MFSRMTSRLRDRGNVLRASTAPCVEALERRQLLSGAPNAPFALTATASGAGPVQFSFVDSADNETGFIVRRSTAGGAFADVKTLGPSTPFHATLTYTDNSVVAGTSYSYEVVAVNGPYSSSVAGPVSVQLAPPPGGTTTNPGGAPGAPFGLSAKSNPAGGATVSFFDGATNETGFVVERAASAAGPFVMVGSLSPSVGKGQLRTFNDPSALAGSTYFYTAYAVNGGFTSSTPAPVSVTITSTGPAAPSAPSNLTAVPTGPTTIKLTFTNNANNETSFLIERTGGGDNIAAFTVNQVVAAGQQVTYIDTTAQPGKTLSYQVIANNGVVQSSPSAPATATTPFGVPPGTLVLDPNFDGGSGSAMESRQLNADRIATTPGGGPSYVLSNLQPNGTTGYRGPEIIGFTAGTLGMLNGVRIDVNSLLPSPMSTVGGIAVQASGKIVIGGRIGNALAVARFNADGSLDKSFGNGGEYSINLGGNEQVADMAIAPDGSIYVGGDHDVYQSTNHEFFAVRFTANGFVDKSFGFNGISKGDQKGLVNAFAIAVDPSDGSVVVVGGSAPGATAIVGAVEGTRLLPNGTAANSFTLYPSMFGNSYAEGVTIQQDHKIVVVGHDGGVAFANRLNPDGTPDPTWVGPGPIANNQDVTGADLRSIVQLSDGSYVAVGFLSNPTGGGVNSETLITHLKNSGQVDPSGGGNGGLVTQDFTGGSGKSNSSFSDVAITADGSIFAAGQEQGEMLVSDYRIV